MLTFTHEYDSPGTYNVVVRLDDDGGQTNDYNVTQVVQAVAPAATFGSTSPWYAISSSGGRTVIMNPADLLQFTDVTPANDDNLQYCFNVSSVPTEEPTMALPVYVLGKTLFVSGYILDTVSGLQSPTYSMDVLMADYTQPPIQGTLAAQGETAPPNSDSSTIELPSGMPTSLAYTVGPGSLHSWPSNLGLSLHYDIKVYDASVGASAAPLSETSGYADGGFTLPEVTYANFRRIVVTVQVQDTGATGQFLGYRFPYQSATDLPDSFLPNSASGGWVSDPYTVTYVTAQPPTLLQQLSNGLQGVVQLASDFSNNAVAFTTAVLTNPGQLLTNLLGGVQNAVTRVASDLTNPNVLANKLFQWLASGTALSTLNFNDPNAIVNFLLQYSGLTWSHLSQVIQQQLGVGNSVAAPFINALFSSIDPSQGGTAANIADFLSNLQSNLGQYANTLSGLTWSSLMQQIEIAALQQLTVSLARMVPQLLAKFVPGGNVATSLYQGLTFVVNNRQQMGDFLQGVVNGMGTLAASVNDPSQLAGFTNTLVVLAEDQGLPLLLNFAAGSWGWATFGRTCIAWSASCRRRWTWAAAHGLKHRRADARRQQRRRQRLVRGAVGTADRVHL